MQKRQKVLVLNGVQDFGMQLAKVLLLDNVVGSVGELDVVASFKLVLL